MEVEEISRRVAEFESWHYQFDLEGVLTPAQYPAMVNRHRQRARYFFDPLVELSGGSLRGKRVLDLGCNAGYWSLLAADAGCDFVFGIDGRQMHIDQANLVFEIKGVESSRYSFIAGNVFEHDLEAIGHFDIVLCLGLLYHVARPVELLERIAQVNTDLLVIDTRVSVKPGLAIDLRHEGTDDVRSTIESGLVMHPSRETVVDLTAQFGYQTVPMAINFADRDMGAYVCGERLAFMCAKRTSLSALSAEPAAPILARMQSIEELGFRAVRRGLFKARHRLRSVAKR